MTESTPESFTASVGGWLALLVVVTAIGCSRAALPVDPAVEPRREECNGLDDDFDGAIDEGFADRACGMGACRNVVPGCVDGVVPECRPLAPQAEACNGADDDCNGLVDEGLPIQLRDGPITVLPVPFSRATELVETPDGLLAVISASGEEPRGGSVTTRTISFDGELTGEPRSFGMRPTQGPTATASADGLTHLTMCVPFGFESRQASQLMDALGDPVGPLVRRQPTRSCGATEGFSIWTGERHLTAWVENSSAPTLEAELLFDVHDENAQSVRSEVLLPQDANLSAQPYFVRREDRVLMVAGRSVVGEVTQQLQAFVFDRAGARVAGPIAYDTPDRFGPLEPRLVRTAADDALLLVPDRLRDGLVAARLGFDGELRTPLRFVDGATGRYSHPDVKPLPGGGSVWAASVDAPDAAGVVLILDDDANIVDRYAHRQPDERYMTQPSVVPRDGRYYLLYFAGLDEDEFEIRLAILGCGR